MQICSSLPDRRESAALFKVRARVRSVSVSGFDDLPAPIVVLKIIPGCQFGSTFGDIDGRLEAASS